MSIQTQTRINWIMDFQQLCKRANLDLVIQSDGLVILEEPEGFMIEESLSPLEILEVLEKKANG